MEPPEIAVEVLGCDAAETSQEPLDLAVAAVDGLDVQGAAHTLAGGAVDALVRDVERRCGGWIAAVGVGDEQGIPGDDRLQRLPHAVGVEGRQGVAEGCAGARSAATRIGTCSREMPRLRALPPRRRGFRSPFRLSSTKVSSASTIPASRCESASTPPHGPRCWTTSPGTAAPIRPHRRKCRRRTLRLRTPLHARHRPLPLHRRPRDAHATMDRRLPTPGHRLRIRHRSPRRSGRRASHPHKPKPPAHPTRRRKGLERHPAITITPCSPEPGARTRTHGSRSRSPIRRPNLPPVGQSRKPTRRTAFLPGKKKSLQESDRSNEPKSVGKFVPFQSD